MTLFWVSLTPLPPGWLSTCTGTSIYLATSGGTAINSACSESIHEHCRTQNFHTGFGPLAYNPLTGQMHIACLKSN